MAAKTRSRSRMPRAGVLALVLTLIGGTLAACAEEPGAGPSDPPVTPTTVADDIPGPADPDDVDDGPPPLAWLPPGPADPADPPPNFWYALLASRQCDTLIAAEDGPLWTAAGWLCDGINTGAVDSWATGIDQLAQVEVAPTGCLEQAAFAFLTRLVAHYEEHGQPDEFAAAEAGDTACALGLTGVAAENSGLPEVSGCAPEPVRLMGRLIDVTSATVAGHSVEVANTGTHRYVFTPPPGDPGEVLVTAHTADGAVPGTATLTYTAEGCPTGP